MDLPSEELHEFERNLKELESEMSEQRGAINVLESSICSPELLEMCPELFEIGTDVLKHEYRVKIMENSIAGQTKSESIAVDHSTVAQSKAKPVVTVAENAGEDVQSVSSNTSKDWAHSKNEKPTQYIVVEKHCCSIVQCLKELFAHTIEKMYPNMNDLPILLVETTTPKFGDYQFNSSMIIAKRLCQSGVKTNPRNIAHLIMDNVMSYYKETQGNIIEKMEVAGGGYINVFLSKCWIENKIHEIATKGFTSPQIVKRKVVVDFSSPNIAKEMHVGHLRSTIIGDALCSLFEYLGFEVLRLNHLGDWGTQFGMLIAHLQDRFPNYLKETPLISDLQALYKESKTRFDSDAKFKARALECVVKLQNYDPDIIKAWKMICSESSKDFNHIYQCLDIKIMPRGESFYQEMMEELVNEFDRIGVLENDDGRKVFFVKGYDVPLIIEKTGGGFTYDTSDLATLKQRLHVEKADWCVYVVDAGQSLHLRTVFEAGRQLGWYKSEEKRIVHVPFGLVLGEDRKKFKTRSGDTVKLRDLLLEGVKWAGYKLEEKQRDKEFSTEEFNSVREAVAYGCIKYTDLSQCRIKDYVFSYEKMLDARGNTAVYLLYAYARIRSICRNTGVSENEIKKYLRELSTPGLFFSHELEIKLAKAILKFSDCILDVLESFMLHQICDYVYQLATVFHDFYTECYVIHKNGDDSTVDYNRLVLCKVTADTMSDCFKILGIRTVERL